MVRIFLVDDDRSIIDVYRNILEIKDHEIVDVAFDGQEAMEIYKTMKIKPDIVILDHRMPLKNGINTMKEIHNIEPMQCVIFVTADYDAAKNAMELGAHSFILKPFRMDDLFNSIEMALTQIKSKKNKIRESLLAIITRMGDGNPGTLNKICDKIEEDIISKYVPGMDEKITIKTVSDWVCGFFNEIEFDFSSEVDGNTITLTNKKCHWKESAGPNPNFCFITKCIISRFAGRTGREFNLETKQVIMDGASECIFELKFH